MGSGNRKRGASPLDAAMALLGAGAVGFVFYAMPDALFTEAVAVSGLPQVLPAAQPPLGFTARIAAAAGGAILTFASIWFLLRALAPKKPQPKQKPGPVEIDIAPPKLRKADAHPDAPARRPLFAGLFLRLAEQAPEPEPEAEPAAADSEFEPDSIHHLMQRLERGLMKREGRDSDEAPGVLPIQRPHEIDDRLRSAIDGLQQLARRG